MQAPRLNSFDSTIEGIADDDTRRTVLFARDGIELEDFFCGHQVGKRFDAFLTCKLADALIGMADCDLEDTKKIQKFQLDIKAARLVLDWMQEVVSTAGLAETALEQNNV